MTKSIPDVTVFPATHFVTPAEKMEKALVEIERELEERVKYFQDRGQLLEAQRIEPVSYTHLDVYKRQALYIASKNGRRISLVT